MNALSAAELRNADRLIDLALEEDLSFTGDRTSTALIPLQMTGSAAFVARKPGVLAGLPVAQRVLQRVSSELTLEPQKQEGDRLDPKEPIAIVRGPMRAILTAERTALNFLQRLCGIATWTRRYVDAVAGCQVQILDTRKTTPGWRLLEKYAVRMGGGTNHRIGLYDGILIKDNHLAPLKPSATAIQQAIDSARKNAPNLPIEVEVDRLDQLEQALACRPAIVLLDNMSLDQLRTAVTMRNQTAPEVRLEASGGVNLDTVRSIAETGVDRISIGALTHSATALDIGLDYV